MIPAKFNYVRGFTRTRHLIEAPLSMALPLRDSRPTGPALCGRRMPAGLTDWGTVCGSVAENAPVCRRCVRVALRVAKRVAA